MEEIVRIIMDKAPEGILGWVLGVVMIIALLTLASKVKSIPFKILFGESSKNGKTYITKEELRENCERRQIGLDKSLNRIIDNTEKTSRSVGEIRERLSYMEGALGIKKQAG